MIIICKKAAIMIYRQVKFYEQISYTLLNSDGNFNSNLDLNIGAVVQIKEENGVSYVIIKAIFTHKYNDDLTYAFIWVDWLRESLIIDPILQCPIYELQTAENTRWYRVHPITTIRRFILCIIVIPHAYRIYMTHQIINISRMSFFIWQYRCV